MQTIYDLNQFKLYKLHCTASVHEFALVQVQVQSDLRIFCTSAVQVQPKLRDKTALHCTLKPYLVCTQQRTKAKGQWDSSSTCALYEHQTPKL